MKLSLERHFIRPVTILSSFETQRLTTGQRNAFHMPDGPEQQKRDALFASHLGKDIVGKFPSRWYAIQLLTLITAYMR